ncbi:MAG TPA: 4Fe-4S dicluster domain-containing protein [Tepidisphaeraceae bacterium]|jgi:Fe-S-cluster-containing dehydrogenase component
MIHLEYIDRARSTQTTPVVCMHCENPTCAQVCPADAIKKTADGVVQSARKPRCIACSNCVLACPFGVPKMKSDFELMMKCDMCYDRTSEGKKPMCATVCPSQALFFGTEDEIETLRPRSRPVNEFKFGRELVRTKVFMMVPVGATTEHIDVTAAMNASSSGRRVKLSILGDESTFDVMTASMFEPEGEGAIK